VPKVLRVAIAGATTPSLPWLTRFFVQYAGTAPTPSQAQTYATTVGFAYQSRLLTLLSAADSQTLVTVTDLSSDTGAFGEDTSVRVGTRTGTDLPAQIALVCSYAILRRYRGGHPRGYWRFGVEADTPDAQGWASTFITTVQNDLGLFFQDVLGTPWTGGGPLTQVNVSYFQGYDPPTIDPVTNFAKNNPKRRSGGPIVDQVVSRTVRSDLGTQRRRVNFRI